MKNCEMIQKAIDLEIPLGDIDSTEGKMIELISLMGLSAECMAKAKEQVLVKQGMMLDILRREEPNTTSTMIKMLLESRMATELTLYEYSERLNRAIVHCVDALRTSISKYKMERELSSYGK